MVNHFHITWHCDEGRAVRIVTDIIQTRRT